MESISKGVCAATGFTANGVYCGIRKNRLKRDLALIKSDRPAAAAAVFTRNLVQGAPIRVSRDHLALSRGLAQAIICNSGNANTCNDNGVEIAMATCALVSRELNIPLEQVLIASTGVIGEKLSLEPFAAGLPELAAGLGQEHEAAAEAIMTTDTRLKEAAVSFTCGGVECHLGGMAKGSGMIHPNMATMLAFITCDAAIEPALLQQALAEDVESSFNMLSIDGDTSTNDTVFLLANGAAGNPVITGPGADYDAFRVALSSVTIALTRMLAADGEGASKMLECRVSQAPDQESAQKAAKAVICSSLVKTAMCGADANWGRVLCALGYAGAALDVSRIEVGFSSVAGEITVCENGSGIPFSEERAKAVLSAPEIIIRVDLHQGEAAATAWGCDLTTEYVHINGDYRS